MDVNGYRHGGIWPLANIQNDAEFAKSVRADGGVYVLLPKSFGPFNPDTIVEFGIFLQYVDLAFARDNASLLYAADAPNADNVRFCPDYSIEVTANCKREASLSAGPYCVYIPNTKLVERGLISSYGEYSSYIQQSMSFLTEQGYTARVLFHQEKDFHKLDHRLRNLGLLPKYYRDPRKAKAHIKRAALVVSSRYHGMISALTQSVPCVVIGWSHKYLGFLENYAGGRDLLLPFQSTGALVAKVQWLEKADNRVRLVEALDSGNEKIYVRCERMWDEVAQLASNRIKNR